MTYTCPDGSATLYYLYDGLQNIAALCNNKGETVAHYTYDAWGKILSEYTVAADGLLVRWMDNAAAGINPFRYKGYFYDEESGLYYLNSRYYDPVTGRFLNADSYINPTGDILGYNMYAYCGNNPIMGYDPMGEWNWGNIIKAVAIVITVTVVVAATIATAGSFAIAAGAVSATAVTAATTGAIVGGLVAGSAEIVSQCVVNGTDDFDYGDIAIESLTGSLHGAIDGISSTATSMGKSLMLQSALLGIDGYNGFFTDNVLAQRVLDGGANYGVGAMIKTALIRSGANLWHNRKGIWDNLYE